jgi:hypothetical protein
MILVFVVPSPVVESRMDLMISSLLRYFAVLFLIGKNQFLLPIRVAYYHFHKSQVWNSNLEPEIFRNDMHVGMINCIF